MPPDNDTFFSPMAGHGESVNTMGKGCAGRERRPGRHKTRGGMFECKYLERVSGRISFQFPPYSCYRLAATDSMSSLEGAFRSFSDTVMISWNRLTPFFSATSAKVGTKAEWHPA